MQSQRQVAWAALFPTSNSKACVATPLIVGYIFGLGGPLTCRRSAACLGGARKRFCVHTTRQARPHKIALKWIKH
eukprot:5988413-Amphidinium_carterae.1